MVFPWERYWAKRGDSITLDQRGYLAERMDGVAFNTNANLTTLSEVWRDHCLILLGEPGIGKSTNLKELRNSMEKNSLLSEIRILWFDLSRYSSEDRLVRDVFQSDTAQDWKRSENGGLYLFFDGYDEGLSNIKSLGGMLIDQTKKLARERQNRLFIRIACRSALWTEPLEKSFRGIWGTITVLEIGPTPL